MDFSIKVENLTKQFGDLVAVDKVNLAIKPGQICGFLGPNGAGKSTTLRMLCGLITPTAGQGQILGLDIVTDAEEQICTVVEMAAPSEDDETAATPAEPEVITEKAAE